MVAKFVREMRWMALTAPLALLLAACQAPPPAPAIVNGPLKLSAKASAEYLDRISAQSHVGEAEAFQGVLMVLGVNRDMTFEEAVKLLRQRKLVGEDWDFRADRPITKGKVAYLFYKALSVRGGVTLTLLGPNPWYCLKELQYRGWMTPGMSYNSVTGMEFVAILARMDELRQTGKVSEVMSGQEGGQGL